MKKTIIGLVATTVLAGGAFADTVQFGNTWGDEGVGDNTSSSETATITTNGITFSLAITGSDKINLPSNADALGITGGNSGQSDNVRISATTNGPQEWIEFSLTVSGATENLNSLSLGNVGLDYLADGEGLDGEGGVLAGPGGQAGGIHDEAEASRVATERSTLPALNGAW